MRHLPLILALFLSAPLQGADLLLARDQSRLRLLSAPTPHHWDTPHLRPQEGAGSHLDTQCLDGVITLDYALDVAGTPWWCYARLTQQRDGTVEVRWSHSEHGTPIVSWYFESFEQAWQCPQVRKSFSPAFEYLHQTLPTLPAIHSALYGPPVATEARRRTIVAWVMVLGDKNPRRRGEAARALLAYPELPEVLRTTTLPCCVRQRAEAVADRQRAVLTEGQRCVAMGW